MWTLNKSIEYQKTIVSKIPRKVRNENHPQVAILEHLKRKVKNG